MKIMVGISSYKIHTNKPHDLYGYTARSINSMVESLRRSPWKWSLVLIDDLSEDKFLEDLREYCLEGWMLIHNETIGSTSKIYNRLFTDAWKANCDFAMYVQNDFKTYPQAMLDLHNILAHMQEEKLQNKRSILTEPHLYWGKSISPHGNAGTEMPWFCFVINKPFWDKFGPWDERYKVYWDWDMEHRLNLSSFKCEDGRLCEWDVGVHFLGKTTGNCKEQITVVQDKEIFKEKWGFPVW